MAKAILSHSMREVLIKHLLEIEDEKEMILDEFYPNETEERGDFLELINGYIKFIESYVAETKAEKSENGQIPFVIIGSVVEVEDTDYGDTEKFQIVSPFKSRENVSMDCASYLSPMGKALLLKKAEDKVEIKTPAGKSTFIIKSIELPAESV